MYQGHTEAELKQKKTSKINKTLFVFAISILLIGSISAAWMILGFGSEGNIQVISNQKGFIVTQDFSDQVLYLNESLTSGTIMEVNNIQGPDNMTVWYGMDLESTNISCSLEESDYNIKAFQVITFVAVEIYNSSVIEIPAGISSYWLNITGTEYSCPVIGTVFLRFWSNS